MNIEQTLLTWCREQALFQPGDKVIAACSGGADSMAMLLFLLRCRTELGIRLAVAHVDHGIRGEVSHQDAAFVADFCRRNSLELFSYDAAAAGVEIPLHPSEDWARQLRYGWFDALAAEQGAKIATAHTLNDQAETLLFRLARGSGIHGMAGIAPKRGPYVRPCLCLTRQDTEAYCAFLGQSYVQDATNQDLTYARNRLRHRVLPELSGLHPAAVASMGRFAARMRELDSWLTEQATALLEQAKTPGGFDLTILQQAKGPVLDTALTLLLPQATQTHMDLLRDCVLRGHGAVQPSPKMTLRVENGILFSRSETRPALPQPLPPQPALPGRYALPGGYVLELRRESAKKYEKFIKNVAKAKKGLTCCADYDKIDKSVQLRVRRPGDRFSPDGRSIHKTLKKYYNEQAVPVRQRPLLPLLAQDSEVLWLWGSGFAAGLAPDAGTQTVLVVECLAGPDIVK